MHQACHTETPLLPGNPIRRRAGSAFGAWGRNGCVFTVDANPALTAHPAHGGSNPSNLAGRLRALRTGLQCRGVTLDRATPVPRAYAVRSMGVVGATAVLVATQRAAKSVPPSQRNRASSHRQSWAGHTPRSSRLAHACDSACSARTRGGAGVGLRRSA